MERERRVILESVKYLSAREVVQVSEVCRHWHSLCMSYEVWLCLLGDTHNSARLTMSPVPTLLSAYRLFHTKLLYYVSHDRICSFNLVTSKSHSIPIPAMHAATSTFQTLYIGSDHVFIFRPPTTCSINMQTGLITNLPNLPIHRIYPGMIFYHRNVYVLGGQVASLPTRICSLFTMDTKTWSNLPDSIKPRQCFNPVSHQGHLLLVNGYHPTVESFHPPTSVFTLLHIKTGHQLSTLTYIHTNRLCITGQSEHWMWDLRNYTLLKEGKNRTLMQNFSVFPPIIYLQNVYFVVNGGGIISLNLDTLDLQRVSFSLPKS